MSEMDKGRRCAPFLLDQIVDRWIEGCVRLGAGHRLGVTFVSIGCYRRQGASGELKPTNIWACDHKGSRPSS